MEVQQAEAAGWRVRDHFALPEEAWEAYYGPLAERIEELEQGGAFVQLAGGHGPCILGAPAGPERC